MSQVDMTSTSSITRRRLVFERCSRTRQVDDRIGNPDWGVASQAPPTRTTFDIDLLLFKIRTGDSGELPWPPSTRHCFTFVIFESSCTARTSLTLPDWRSSSVLYIGSALDHHIVAGDPEVGCPVATYSGISTGRAKRISTCGSRVLVIRPPLTVLRRWRPLFSTRSMIGAAIRPLLGIASRTDIGKRVVHGFFSRFFRGLAWVSECLEFPGNDLFGDAGDVCQPVVDNPVDIFVDVLQLTPDPAAPGCLPRAAGRSASRSGKEAGRTSPRSRQPSSHSPGRSGSRGGCTSCRYG